MKSPSKSNKSELPVLFFERPEDWAAWLDENHATSPGVWLRLAKKKAGVKSPSYDEALEEALCYGWIDGQKKPGDESSWLQKFTPRGPRSIWSKINRERIERLSESGRMQAAGREEVEKAKRDGRWEAAYDSQSGSTVPGDFQAELETKTPRRRPSSPPSTARTGTPSCSGCRRPRSPRCANGGCGSSWRCWSGVLPVCDSLIHDGSPYFRFGIASSRTDLPGMMSILP